MGRKAQGERAKGVYLFTVAPLEFLLATFHGGLSSTLHPWRESKMVKWHLLYRAYYAAVGMQWAECKGAMYKEEPIFQRWPNGLSFGKGISFLATFAPVKGGAVASLWGYTFK